MAITIKTAREIGLMRESCKILSDLLNRMEEYIVPGISTYEIDEKAAAIIKEYGVVSNFLDYDGYPASICTSVNEEVVHGIPRKDRILKEGDIITVDAGVIYKGYNSDAARTFCVGKVAPEVLRLVDAARDSFFEGIKKAHAGTHLYEISNAIDDYITPLGYGIVRELIGHGIGTDLHEDPEIPNYRQKRRGPKLQAGMTICVEPMITLGSPEINWKDDGWTVATVDGKPAAHYENTILITDGEPEILTLV